MIVKAEKKGSIVTIKLPLNQADLKPTPLARYIMCLYEFNFIPSHAKCFITAEYDDGILFCVKTSIDDNLFERTFHTVLYRMPSAAFETALEEAGFEVRETSHSSWEISKNN